MKDNLTPTKELLTKALGILPGDNVLQEVRYHIRQALTKLEQTEKKRSNRAPVQKTKHQTWHEMLTNGVQNPNTPKRTMEIINRMIDEEKKKLNEIQVRKSKMTKDGAADDGLETLFD